MPPKNIEETQAETRGDVNSVVADLQRQIHDLQEQLIHGVPLKQAVRVTKHEARVMFYDGLPIVKFGKVYKKIIQNEEVLFIDITTRNIEGEEKITAVNYLDVLNESPRILCTIQSMERDVTEKPQGSTAQQARVSVSKADPCGAVSGVRDFSRKDVELTETAESITATIKIEEGDLKGTELVLPAESLNP